MTLRNLLPEIYRWLSGSWATFKEDPTLMLLFYLVLVWVPLLVNTVATKP